MQKIESKFRVAPRRNQFGMISIVDEEGNVHKVVKSSHAAAEWIMKQNEALSNLAEIHGFTFEEVSSMSVTELQRDILERINANN